MKVNKFSRVIALLLSLVMLLGTLPTSYAEGSTIVENAKYQAALDAVVQMYYDELMACETYEEALVLYGNRDWDHFHEFLNRLSEEERNTLDTDLKALFDDFVERTSVLWMIPPTNFARVAGFMPPVSGVSTYALRSARIATDLDGNNVALDKYISSGPDENGNSMLTLDVYTTGAKTTVTTDEEIPTDIVLVLDQSGSMEDCINCGEDADNTSCTTYEYTATTTINNNSSAEYYYMNGDSYSRAYYCQGRTGYYSCEAGWYTEAHGNNWYEHGGDMLTPITEQNPNGTQFYTRTEKTGSHVARIDALTDAVQAFVNEVKRKAEGIDATAETGDDTNHRIAVVGFSSTSGSNNYDNSEILSVSGTNSGNVGVRYSQLQNSHYQQALQSMDTTAGQTMVNNAVNALEARGATCVNLGLEMAERIFEQNPIENGKKRNRVVIVFTDGTPTSGSSYESNIANSAIANAKDLKQDYGATVYTVGVFSGANGSNPASLPANNGTGSNRENRFMHLVSSNYPSATNMSTPNSINSNLKNGQSFYLSAGNSSTLSGIFETIASQVQSGGSSTTLTESTVIKDIVASQFMLPSGADTSNIKVYTRDYSETGFGDRVAYSNAVITFSEDKQSISVTNFNFSENWVGTETTTVNGQSTVKYRGKMLSIDIPITVEPSFLGGNDAFTNDSAGVYAPTGEGGALELVEVFPRPDVDIPVKAIEPVIVDQHIYLSNYASPLDMFARDSKDLLQYTIGNNKYSVDGANNAYVDITYEVTAVVDEQPVVIAKYKIAKGSTTVEVIEENHKQYTFTKDTVFTYTCTVDGSTTNDDGTIKQNKASDYSTATVYVYKPVLTFQDTQEKYFTTPKDDSNAAYSEDAAYFADKNLVSVQWMNGATEADSDIMRGEEPRMQLDYGTTALLDSTGKVVSKTDVAVNVTVMLDGETDKGTFHDYSSNSMSIRLACACDKEKPNCEHNEESSGVTSSYSPEFIVHVYDVYGHLTVTKTVVTPSGVTPAYDEFTFTLTLTDKDNAALEGDFNYTIKSGETTVSTGTIGNGGTFKLKHGQTITIAELPPETKYTVTENVPTGYAANPITSTGSITAGQTANVGVENTYSVGSLKIEKDVTGSAAPADAEFTFTVNLKAKDGSALAGSYSYTGSKSGTISNGGTITLKDGQFITIANLPVDATYTVTETSNADYITDPSDYKRTGTISTTLSEAKFTNTYQKQNLTITKVVNDSTFTTGSRTFTFEVIDAKGEKHPVSISVDAADKADKTKNTETILVPVGRTTVTETTTEGYATTMNGATGTSTVVEINENASATVDVVNTANSNRVINITKSWNDNSDALGYRPDAITVTLSGNGVDYTSFMWDKTTTENQWATSITVPMFDINGNEITYKVSETQVAKYDAPVITGSAKDGFTITNSIDVGSLSITKEVDTSGTVNSDFTLAENFTFTVELPQGTYPITGIDGQTNLVVDSTGKATITLTNGQTVTIKDIAPEAPYKITEDVPNGYVLAPSDPVTGNIVAGDTKTHTFTNTVTLGTLKITKVIKDADGNIVTDSNVNNDVFTFSVQIGDVNYTQTIKGAGTLEYTGLPIGLEYEVIETGMPTGYTVVAPNGGNGTIVAGESAVTVTNTYTTGSLDISKTVEGTAAPTGENAERFTFNVTLPEGTFNYVVKDAAGTQVFDDTVENGDAISLTGGQTATITGLPEGASYTVAEDVHTKYQLTSSSGTTGTISSTETAHAQFTNTYKFQNLTITKVVKDSTFETGTREFNFDVAKSDGETEVVSIKVDASTKTKSATVLVPVGDTTVTEQADSAAGYAVTYIYGNETSVTAPKMPISYEGEWSITVTNTAKVDRDITITKIWDDKNDELKLRPKDVENDTIEVTLNGKTDIYNVNTTEFEWDKSTENRWSDTVTVPKFDANGQEISYSVKEQQVELYDAPVYGGDVVNGFTITNSIAVGDLSITKTVEDEEDDGVDPTDLDFTFQVTLKDAEGNALSDISYTGDKTGKVSNGDTITLKADQTVTLENLPEGSAYAVEEINIPVGYTLKTQTGIVGTIAAGTTAAAEFTNIFEVADLVITKKIVDEKDRDFAGTTKDDDVFTINVTLPAGTYTMSNGESFVSTGAAKAITITGANSVTFQNIPINTVYTVVEDTTKLPTGYALKSTVDSDAGKLSDDGATVTITNTYLNGELAITKNVVNTTDINQNRATTFDFKVTLTDASGTALTGEFDYKVTEEGASDPVSTGEISHNGTIRLEHGQTATILELPPETKYTVTETVPTGYVSETTATEYNSTEGAIDAGLTDAITVTNTFDVADLTVTKVITGGDENTSDDIFTFEIELPEGTYVIEGAKTIGADGAVADLTTLSVGDDGKAMFVLVGQSTTTIKNIPINTAYSIVETSLPTGYTFGSVTGEATATITASEKKIEDAINADENAVTFTNAYAKGGLTIEKEVIGTDAPKATETFTFTVDVKDAEGNAIAGTYAYTIGSVAGSITTGTVNEAERQITLKHGEKAIFETLPAGAVVTATETENADYETTPALEQRSTITAVTSELKFTNTYQYGSLTISKSGIDATLDPNAKTVYRVTGNGVDLTVVVDKNGSVKINRLPLGDYTVTELTDWSWRYEATTANTQTDTITATENAAVAFGNERDKTQWLDGETSAENKFDPVTEQQEVSENE